MNAIHHIDVHQHVIPPFYAKALPANGGDPSGSVTPEWSPESAIQFMDSLQIDTGMLSVTTPSVVGWPLAERRKIARRINEYVAEVVAARPRRFGSFATLPLPDIDGCSSRKRNTPWTRCKLTASLFLRSYEGRYLGDPVFEPLWAELDRRHAIVFEHPGATPGQPAMPSVAGGCAPNGRLPP